MSQQYDLIPRLWTAARAMFARMRAALAGAIAARQTLSLDQKHANEIQIVLVIADIKVGKGMSSVTYEIDTRPDAVLEPLQKAERANKGMSGKATTSLMQKGDTAMLSFIGQTASGVKLEGSVTCRKVT